jgi:hypothetical protein
MPGEPKLARTKNGSTTTRQGKKSEATMARNDGWTSRIGRGYRGKREGRKEEIRRQARQSDLCLVL